MAMARAAIQDDELEVTGILTRALAKWCAEFDHQPLDAVDPAIIHIEGFDCRITPDDLDCDGWTTATVELSAGGKLIAAAKVQLRDQRPHLH
jgi:hypothetical protein